MLHIALMASENRAAAALSRYFPGGRPAFLAAMNAKAKQLGMTDTHFESPSGLTSENVSSARDLVKMVNAAYQYPMIRQFSTDHSYEVYTGKRSIAYNSTNALVRNPTWDIGLQKTGFINEAGECLVMQATIHGRPMIMVLLDSSGKYSRFADATRLRTWLDNGGDHAHHQRRRRRPGHLSSHDALQIAAGRFFGPRQQKASQSRGFFIWRAPDGTPRRRLHQAC